MISALAILRPALCLLSILVFYLLGLVGEELLNQVYVPFQDFDAELPEVTEWLVMNFDLNAGHFLHSLTPFMLLMPGVAALPGKGQRPELFWSLFVGVWLLAVAYFLFFVIALLVPFQLLLQIDDGSPVPAVVWTINVIIALSIAGVLLAARRKNAKAKAPPIEGKSDSAAV